MTKDAYFEMCEALGSEPLEEEIPVDYEDLHTDVQEALNIYHKLKDEWDYMGGNYVGKNSAGILDIFNILEIPIEDRKTMYNLIFIIDSYRSKAIMSNKKATEKVK